mmetsp:Transcript_57632/g.122573  ORF Transcript_57632/g.122573 Transcript_57632/m.122573 type:complete len:208 (+) Transcript_57632:139-762(+)
MMHRPSSCPTLHDWTQKWDAAPHMASVPRWSQGKSNLSKTSLKVRETFVDQHKRKVSWVPGPGSHGILRWPDCAPRKRMDASHDEASSDSDGASPRLDLTLEPRLSTTHGEWGTRTIPHRFSREVRRASLKSLPVPNPKEKSILVPSSHFTPGPGAYCAFSTFGAPSGPSRKRYFGSGSEDNMGLRRSPEPFHRQADQQRGFGQLQH